MRGDILPEENNEMKTAEQTDEQPVARRYPVAVLQKVNKLRGMVLAMDWAPDKIMKVGQDRSKWYPYLSIDKMKANLGPAFAKVGLEMIPSFEDIQFKGAIGNMSQHVVLTMVVDVVDIESGEVITYRTPGEAGDSGDKAIVKAQTYALKSWLSTALMIADGLDAGLGTDEGDSKTFVAPTALEAVEAKAKVLNAGVKPVKKPVAPVKKDEKPVDDKKKPSPIQEAAMKKIESDWNDAVQSGKVGADRFTAMSDALSKVVTSSDAVDFIVAYEKVE